MESSISKSSRSPPPGASTTAGVASFLLDLDGFLSLSLEDEDFLVGGDIAFESKSSSGKPPGNGDDDGLGATKVGSVDGDDDSFLSFLDDEEAVSYTHLTLPTIYSV